MGCFDKKWLSDIEAVKKSKEAGMTRPKPHSGLGELAFRMIEDDVEWTESGIAAALVQRFRDQGTRITERLRDDCQDAARQAVLMNREKIAAQRRGETFVNPYELYK
jgi:hypothetical protein